MMEPMMAYGTSSQTKRRVDRQSSHLPDVKIGLLAGIELCGSLRSVLEHLHCDHSRRSSWEFQPPSPRVVLLHPDDG
eukprot:scaffold263045_cov39-Attheya_sp.AAC.2